MTHALTFANVRGITHSYTFAKPTGADEGCAANQACCFPKKAGVAPSKSSVPAIVSAWKCAFDAVKKGYDMPGNDLR
jgi:hypothetical protein